MHGSLEVEGYLNESMQKNGNGSWEFYPVVILRDKSTM